MRFLIAIPLKKTVTWLQGHLDQQDFPLWGIKLTHFFPVPGNLCPYFVNLGVKLFAHDRETCSVCNKGRELGEPQICITHVPLIAWRIDLFLFVELTIND